MMISSTDNITNLLETYLDVQSRRTEIIAGNIANADTPGYVAKELDFDQHLRDAARNALFPQLPGGESETLSLAPAKVVDREAQAVGLDGNTVDVGREMAEMAQAGGSFNFGVKMLQSRLRLLRSAIREGR
jgi:flagellar basal-body rod protein FlgB